MRPLHLVLPALLLLPGCASPREAACARWAEVRCQRLWLCTVEHARSNPDFVARHGDSLPACQALEGPRCLAQAACAGGAEVEACLRQTAAAACDAQVEACAPPCG